MKARLPDRSTSSQSAVVAPAQEAGPTDQDLYGNAFANQLLPPGPGRPPTQAAPAPEARLFANGGPYAGQIKPSSGLGGGFHAAYDPLAGRMVATIGVEVHFMSTIFGSGASAHASPQAKGIEERLAQLTGAEREALIAACQWTDADKAAWLAELQSAIEGAWSDQYVFRIPTPGFEAVTASVGVDVDPTCALGRHQLVTVYKGPSDDSLWELLGDPSANRSANQGPITRLASGDVDVESAEARGFDLPADTSVVPDAPLKDLAAIAGSSTGLRGRVVALNLARSDTGSRTTERVSAFQAALERVGLSTGPGDWKFEIKYEADAADEERAMLSFVRNGAPGEGQNTAAHEAGHWLGLGDEYEEGTGKNAGDRVQGDPVDHAGMATAMPGLDGEMLPAPTVDTDDRLMSRGNLVPPEHYAPLYEALRTITGRSDWVIGAPSGKPPQAP